MKGIVTAFLIYISSCLLAGCLFSGSYYQESVIKFHNDPCIKPYKKYHYLTCHPIYVTIGHFLVVVPADFDTDLASIPKWLWTIVAPSHSAFISPSILHDYLYTCHNGFSRKEIDYIFYQALIENEVSKRHAFEIYAAVRLFGSKHYHENDDVCRNKPFRIVDELTNSMNARNEE